MNLETITPLILTFNEAPNIERTVSALKWAKKIVILDSGSTDSTLQILTRFDNVHVIERRFEDHTSQWNFGLSAVETEWVLTLDADYLCTDLFRDELALLQPSNSVYSAAFKYCVFGKPLRGSLYPPRAVLFRTGMYKYKQDGHTQLLDCETSIASTLQSYMLHDDRKALSHWCSSQVKYAQLEVGKLQTASRLTWKDKLRKAVFVAPILTLVYCLIWKGLILEGRAGLYYTCQRVYAELTLSLALLDARMRDSTTLRNTERKS